MKHIEISNLPDSKVKLLLIDCRAEKIIERALQNLNIHLIKVKPVEGVYEAISSHPDIMLNHVGGADIVHAPGLDTKLLIELKTLGYNPIKGESELKLKYPGNIAYNAARVGKYVFHNVKYIDPILKKEFAKKDVEVIHINQGYAKCSMAILSDKLIMTADKGIARAAEKKGIEVIILENTESILLPGLNYGFIGGCSGLIDKNTLAVTGDFDMLKQAKEIRNYLLNNGIKVVSLSDKNMVDLGSLIPLAEFED